MKYLVKFVEMESRIEVARGYGDRELLIGYKISVLQEERVLETGCITK